MWFFVILIILPSCSSGILISSSPSEADVYTNGEYLGKTPIRHWDNEPGGSLLDVRIEQDGYEELNVEIKNISGIQWWPLMF